MQAKNQKPSKEQRIALLQEYMASGLNIREYAAYKNVGYSTLTRWASQLGISLAKTTLPGPDGVTDADADSPNNSKEAFSFINLTDHIKDTAPDFDPSFLSRQIHQREASPCGLEIRMPNGVMVKVDQVPFSALWPQVVEFVRALA